MSIVSNLSSPISSIECRVMTFPIVVPFSIALETLPVATIVIVTCTDMEGRVGIGEAAPFPSLTYDNPDISRMLIEQLKGDFVGLDSKSALELLEKQSSDWRRTSITAFCGLESALFDLIAKQRGISLATLHGSAAIGEIETDITLPIMPHSQVVEFFSIFSTHNFKIIKIKVSGHVADDLDLVLEVKRQQATVAITLDGNQGFDVARAKKLVSSLRDQNIRPLFFEQPLPENDWAGVEQLASTLGISVCLDEAVRTAADVQVIADSLGHCKNYLMINLKIMKSGIMGTTKIMEAAKKIGLPLMIGGMLESEIAMCHSLHLACGRGGVSYFDLDTPFFFRHRPTRNSPWDSSSSLLRCPTGPGLGIDLAAISE